MVVNAAINKYFYVIANVVDGRDIQITSSDYRTFYRHNGQALSLWDGDLGHPRAILHEFGFNNGLSLFLASEIPPGTGLGSSSSVAVAIIKALATLRGRNLTKQEVAELACHVEIETLEMPIGKQDQYAASFGGINTFVFDRNGDVTREPLRLDPDVIYDLERHLLMIFTRSSRNSSTILREQKKSSEVDDSQVIASLDRIKEMAIDVREYLLNGEIDRFGALLDEAWQEKKRLAKGVSNPDIDRWYELARAHGATGGKITGAGGGGFLMLYCPLNRQQAVTEALAAEGLRCMDFQFEFGGARVLMNSTRDVPLVPVTNLSLDRTSYLVAAGGGN
jgi:D-glycero-alpha-D-manno-heptose-7-phosphate kinase